ncbi:methyltransferase family protein [Branchiibius hedensis]|uniref:Methyltransferase domain-containing protein n=1 Tax=Branchiibius hedensis TaxID=672460 RepID=A0A2Y9C166_9MICO|nr:class I SAM-dependent methyltransferase [Branchiibius hedensis]PWJ25008.1 methyltransferase family protein [Branchiibius hedensis]SSA33823.1 Methyltransferase domain-containing protein [Branchiibius hedensis]
MSAFTGSEQIWSSRLGSLRNVVRQHVIAEQLAGHVHGVATVLDIGCGQGTQAIRLAQRGLTVTGIDPATDLLDQLHEAAATAGVRVRSLMGDLHSLADTLRGESFDLVCAHGLLMYLPDPAAALNDLVARAQSGGLLSFTVRNGDALAYRPGIRGDYSGALASFDNLAYRNELGADARAHTLEQVVGWCADLGLSIESWYGVRVLTDGLPASVSPEDVDLESCLAAEVEAGRRDPYRRFGSMLHFIARATG